MNQALLLSLLAWTLGDLAFAMSPPDLQCQAGTTFVDQSCEKWCRCLDGQFKCTDLCPPQPRPICGPNHALIVKEVPSDDPEHRCKCKMNLCVPRPRPIEKVCRYEGKVYKQGDRFIDSRCLGVCRCGAGWISCASLCPPVFINCPPGQEKTSYQHPMDKDGRCFCERQKCREKILEVY